MYYEILVIKNDRHFFATAKRSITDEQTLNARYEVFVEKFPASEGYRVECTCWKEIGEPMKMVPAQEMIIKTIKECGMENWNEQNIRPE